MTRRSLYLTLAAIFTVPAWCADPSVQDVLKKVEDHYNKIKSLQVSFTENYRGQGRVRRGETGLLSLRKPGRMRWDYTVPQGKFLLSDGKDFYFYAPSTNRVEKEKMKQSDDMRAPLAFLLGRLDFDREFQGFNMKAEGDQRVISAQPKSDRLPYRSVLFTVDLEGRIRHLTVTGHDESVLEFAFDKEVMNPKLDDRMFKLQMPAGAELVDTSKEASN